MKAMLPCLILAGGLGTRLTPALGKSLPKVMAPIGERPFLSWMLEWLSRRGVTDVVLSVGHRCDAIKAFLSSTCYGISVSYVEESEPLGTGGAIMHALQACEAPDMIVMNGDTMSNLDLYALAGFFDATTPDLVVAATQVCDASRYGALNFDARSRRLFTLSEARAGSGFINAGVYAINAARLRTLDVPRKFSFERDFLRDRIAALDVRVFPEITEFIDIGVPSDYHRAQSVVPRLLGEANMKQEADVGSSGEWH